MVEMNLIQQRATNIFVQTDFSPSSSENNLEIRFHFNFKVVYADDGKHCKATIEQIAEAVENPQNFNIRVTMEGIFNISPLSTDEEKKEAHIRSYYLLFPYVQALISQLSVNAGFPPLIVQPARITTDKVNIEGNVD